MSVLSWLGRRIKLTDGAFWAAWFNEGESWAGKEVGARNTMSLSTAWACVRLLSQTTGTLPCGMFAKGDTPKPAPQHDLEFILREQPNADMTAVDFWESMMGCLLLWGNAYSEKLYMGAGERRRIVALSNPLLPEFMVVYRDNSGRRKYRYSEPGHPVRTIDESDIMHIRGFGIGGDVGLSVVAYARQTFGTAMATDEAAARTFRNGLRPGGFFLFDQTLNPQQREDAYKALVEPLIGVANAKKVGILEAGVKWQEVNMPPEDAQMLETRGFHVEEICRWFGVPPVLIGHSPEGQTMWGTGVEQVIRGFVTLGLRPLLKRIEMTISRDLLGPNGRRTHFAEFNMEGLLRGDPAARMAFYKEGVLNGIFTRDECRGHERLPPRPGGDVLTVQSQLIPLDQVGKKPEPVPSPTGTPPAVSEEDA